MLILRTIVDEHEHTRRRQSFDQRVDQRLSFGVDPVQVLEHDHDRLVLALTQKQTLHAVQDLLPSLRRVEPLPLRIIGRYVEEPEDSGQEWF